MVDHFLKAVSLFFLLTSVRRVIQLNDATSPLQLIRQIDSDEGQVRRGACSTSYNRTTSLENKFATISVKILELLELLKKCKGDCEY